MGGDPAHEDVVIDAPMVFAGYGITAPELRYDDYAGIDVKGKVVVVAYGAPASFSPSDRALYTDSLNKSRNAAAHGAIGRITSWGGPLTKGPNWEQIVHLPQGPGMRWIDENGVH